MKADTWMPLYVADYRKDTARLTCEQHGAYLLLIMDYWVGGPLPDDDVSLAQIAHLEVRQWRKHRPMLERFFQIRRGQWFHKRVEEEREKAERLAEMRRLNGSKGGRPRKLNETDEEPAAKPTENRGLKLPGNLEHNLGDNRDTKLTETPTRVAPPSPITSPKDKEAFGGRARGTRLPADWIPSDLDRAYALKQGFSAPAVERIAEKFRNYWQAKTGASATKIDWPATWRNWVLEEAERRGVSAPTPAQVDWQ